MFFQGQYDVGKNGATWLFLKNVNLIVTKSNLRSDNF
jgi:hypothetical protein